MEFLTASNKKGLGDKVKKFDNGTLNSEGKNVIVIGGGDTAMDCVRTAVTVSYTHLTLPTILLV